MTKLSPFLILIVTSICACKYKDKTPCQYRLDQLLIIDTPKVAITYYNDTLTEVRDKTENTSTGLYTFDQKKNLRFYGFFVKENQYRYSEEYDSKGNIIRKEGTPLAEYRLWKGNNDTVLFNIFLFSLNKKYEEIEVISNMRDTIRPKYLYKADIYSNMKCFAFKLPIVKTINDLVLYTKGTVINTCTQEKESFSDTTSFQETRL